MIILNREELTCMLKSELEDIVDETFNKKREAELYIDRIEKTIDMINKYKKQKPTIRSEREEVLSLLCFGSLGYCCSAEENCPFRDAVMSIFGVSEDRYKKIKEKAGELLIE